jgi:hypothetical protein
MRKLREIIRLRLQGRPVGPGHRAELRVVAEYGERVTGLLWQEYKEAQPGGLQ